MEYTYTYKDCIQRIRKLEVEEPYLDIIADVSPQCMELIKRLIEVEFKDGLAYSYYGDTKEVIKAFINLWEDKIDEAIRIADKLTYSASKDEYLEVIEDTIIEQNHKQIQFGRNYLPISCDEEKEIYDDITKLFSECNQVFYAKKDEVVHTKPVYFPLPCIEEEMKTSLKRAQKIFELTREILSMIILHRLPQLRSSLECTRNRIRHNLEDLQMRSQQSIDSLYQKLHQSRETYNSLRKLVINPDDEFDLPLKEASLRVKSLQEAWRCSKHTYEVSIKRVKDELEYWQDKLKVLESIWDALKPVSDALSLSLENEQKFKASNCNKQTLIIAKPCLEMRDRMKEQQDDLKKDLKRIADSAITFFAVRGFDRKPYHDSDTTYYADKHCQKIFNVEHSRYFCRMTSDGNLETVNDNDIAYLYDNFGRYYFDKAGEKIYTRDEFGSSYKLDERNLMEKITEDRGLSVSPKKYCQLIGRISIEKNTEPAVLNITGTLDPEITKYLWDCFGYILPEALADVEKLRPEQPMKYLAHRLLVHKYGKTSEEIKMKQDESTKYREEIFEKRKEKITALRKVSRLKYTNKNRVLSEGPDFDTFEEYDAYKAMHDMIKNINTDYYQNNIQN